MGVIAIAVGKLSWKSAAVTTPSLPPLVQAKDVSFYVLQTVLRPEGFETTQFNLPKGTFRVILLNRTGLPDLAIQLSKIVGNKQKLKDFPFDEKKRFRVEETVDLTPGDYLLEVTGHPEWICRLTVSNQ
jgi:hypothetical protein